jgi:hypothetical protein
MSTWSPQCDNKVVLRLQLWPISTRHRPELGAYCNVSLSRDLFSMKFGPTKSPLQWRFHLGHWIISDFVHVKAAKVGTMGG